MVATTGVAKVLTAVMTRPVKHALVLQTILLLRRTALAHWLSLTVAPSGCLQVSVRFATPPPQRTEQLLQLLPVQKAFCVHAAAPALDPVPAGQLRQAADPGVAAYVSAAQAKQELEPAGDDVPLPHKAHAVAPSAVE